MDFFTKRSRRFALSLVLLAGFTSAGLGYSFKEAILRIGPTDKGVESAKEFVSLINKITENRRLGKRVKSFDRFLRRSFEEFDFRQIYGSDFFRNDSQGGRYLTLTGQSRPDNYFIDMADYNYNQHPMKKLGDFSSQVTLNEIESDDVDSYRINIKSRLATKQFSHRSAAEFATGLLKVLDPASIEGLPASKSRYFKNSNDESNRVLNQFEKEFPAYAAFSGRYFHVHKFLEVIRHENLDVTRVELKTSLNMNNIEQDYPELHDYLDGLDNIIRSRINISNTKSNRLLSVLVDTKSLTTTVTFYTQNGRVVPFAKEGEPVLDQAFYLQELRELKYWVNVGTVVSIYGLRVRLDNVALRSDYVNRNQTGELAYRVAYIQKPKVEGAFLGFIPPYLVDVVIPENIDYYAEKFTERLVGDRNRGGTQAQLIWATQDPRNVTTRVNLKTEFVDNRFVRIGAKVWLKEILPSEKAEDEIFGLTSKGARAALKDLSRL